MTRNALMDPYGLQYQDPRLFSDSEDYTTADVFGQMGNNKRRAEYDNSLLGMVHNWATGEQRQPVQLPDNAPLMDQMKEAGMRMLNLPNDMAAGGAKTMAHWLGSAGNPEMVEPLDMLAPLGIGAMAGLGGVVPRGAVGSAGGRLAAGSSENAPRIGVQSVMASAIPGYQNMGQLQRGMIADIYEHAKIGEMPSETAMRIGQRDGVDFAPLDRELGWLDAEVAKIRQADGEPRVVDGFRGGKVSADQPVMFGTDAIELARLFGDVEPVQARFKNALEVDADGKSWRHVPFEAGVHTSDDIANLARERGHDGVVFKNMFESPDYNKTSDTYPNVFTALQRGTVFDNDGNLLFADQSRSSLPGLLTNAVDEPKGFTAYHGSPHDFDDDIIEIVKKYGIAAAASMYGMSQVQDAMASEGP